MSETTKPTPILPAWDWDTAKRDRFAAQLDTLIRTAKKRGIDDTAIDATVFEFEGGRYLVGYARYLREYLYERLPTQKQRMVTNLPKTPMRKARAAKARENAQRKAKRA